MESHTTPKGNLGKRAVVRYADDFVCFCETKEDAEQVQGILAEWLKERGLTLSEEKTRIVHLTEGFRFPGLQHQALPRAADLTHGMETPDQTQQRISTRSAEEAQRSLGEGTGNQCASRSSQA